ncbi:MAG: mucoidy inhibitor MuiA family protein [Symploca sp. SIO1B1]|nr:mucoidy inhibitor MuiA family protein [Symploca sp. SIO1B1]
MRKTVDTRICQVTVYEQQALITRRGVVQLTGEEQELVIAQLPVTLLEESIRLKSSKTNVGLLGVKIERTQDTKQDSQELTVLTQKIGQLDEKKRHSQDLITLLNLKRNFVKNLSSQYMERLTRSHNPEPLDLDKIKDLMSFVDQQYSDLSGEIAQQELEFRQLEKHLQILRGQQQQLATPRTNESVKVIVTLESSVVGELELEVSYIVEQASWIPLYDLRLSATNQKIHLSYLAQVKQSSGENWQSVALRLSNAKPVLGITLPALPSWYINGQEASSPKQGEESSPMVLDQAITMPYPGTIIAPEALVGIELKPSTAQEVSTEVSQQGSIVNFEVSNLLQINSDNTTHTTKIFTQDYPCRTEYIAIPQLTNLAYLQATIANPLNGVTLLPGQVNIFRDNTFVGTAQLQKIAPGQEFTLNLGIDEGLQVERNLVERQVNEELVDNQYRITYAYRIVITNLRDDEVKVRVIEQLPISLNEQIKVHLTHSEPQTPISEKGVLGWSTTLLPKAKQQFYYQFTVEYPPEFKVIGLDI